MYEECRSLRTLRPACSSRHPYDDPLTRCRETSTGPFTMCIADYCNGTNQEQIVALRRHPSTTLRHLR